MGSILSILQHSLELFGSVVVLDPLFKLLSLPLAALGFGLQIIQSAIRKLQFTFLDHIKSTNTTIRRFVEAYLFPTSVLEPLFLFEKMADPCRAFHRLLAGRQGFAQSDS